MTGKPRIQAELPLPPHFDPGNAAKWDHRANEQALFDLANTWRDEHGVGPASSAPLDIHLLMVDMQKSFCLPQGTLYVGGRSGTGAVDDSARLASFIYRNARNLKGITATMDTHFAYQIFFSSFWIDPDGQPLKPYREVTSEQVRRGVARPNPEIAWWVANDDYDWLVKQVEFYCVELEREGKYTLYLWPPHCVVGSDGHPLVGVVHEARMFFSFLRGAQSWVEIKGDNPLTEHYSVFRTEVMRTFDGAVLGRQSTHLVGTLLRTDAVLIAGEASSHCVKNSVEDLLNEIRAYDPTLAKKVYLLTDCMSPVAIPDGKGGFVADFTSEAEAALHTFAEAGVNLVKSSDPMASWPGLG